MIDSKVITCQFCDQWAPASFWKIANGERVCPNCGLPQAIGYADTPEVPLTGPPPIRVDNYRDEEPLIPGNILDE